MWALARFCAPWVSNAGEKGKNALPKERKALGARDSGTAGRCWQPARAFFSFSPGNWLRGKKRAKATPPPRAAIPGFLIDVLAAPLYRRTSGRQPRAGPSGGASPLGPTRP